MALWSDVDRHPRAARSLSEPAHAFDQAHAEALRRIWVVGDVHGERRPLLRIRVAADVFARMNRSIEAAFSEVEA